jgi:glycosyltransferase involved in cell wall biosynthesis
MVRLLNYGLSYKNGNCDDLFVCCFFKVANFVKTGPFVHYKTQFICLIFANKITQFLQKKIIVSVISDLVTDQRVQKECNTLHKIGYRVLLIGRKSDRDFVLKDLPYKTIRFQNLFAKGPLMYLVFNVQLFVYLLFVKADILWSNDLDTLLPNFVISQLKKSKLIYDSHEYFTESVYKKSSKKIWEMLEQQIFPRLKNVITVNNSIKNIYENKYKVPVTVIRNVPYLFDKNKEANGPILPAETKNLIIQGRGINENRGAEEAVLMMQFLSAGFHLYFIGNGTILNKVKKIVRDLNLQSKITFIDPLPYQKMMQITVQGFLGLIFEKIDVADEHLFSLPNKFFDYIHAGIPVLSTEAVEIKSIIPQFNIGTFVDNLNPEEMAKKVIEISRDKEKYDLWKHNTVTASKDLNWEREEKILIDFMEHLS